MSQVVVITGASRGLGLSLAEKFLCRGNKVYGTSRTKKHWPEALKKTEHSKNFWLNLLNVQSEADVKAYIKKIYTKEGRIDILINNAGYGGKLSRVEDLSIKEFEHQLQTNLLGSFLTSKYTIPVMRKQKQGLIINISSMAGRRAVPQLAAYSASKFGVLALTQAIAKENLDLSLKCITVCPGGMNTEMRSDLFGKADAKRQQSPDFVANVIMDIVNEKIELSTGSDITIRHSKITDINVPPSN